MTVKQAVNGNVFRVVAGLLCAIILLIGGWLGRAVTAHAELDGHPVIIERAKNLLKEVQDNGHSIEQIKYEQKEQSREQLQQTLILKDIENSVKILAKEH